MNPIQTKSKVIVYFPNTGVYDAIGELVKQSKPSIKVSFDDLMFTERALTNEEIVDFNLTYRIGYEGYYKVHGEYPKTQVYNVNFVEDSKHRLVYFLKTNLYDYIFIDYKPYICNLLDELKVDFYVVYPDNELKSEYIENILIATNPITKDVNDNSEKCLLDIKDPKLMYTTWDRLMTKIEKSNYKRKIILQRNHYLKDILEKFPFKI